MCCVPLPVKHVRYLMYPHNTPPPCVHMLQGYEEARVRSIAATLLRLVDESSSAFPSVFCVASAASASVQEVCMDTASMECWSTVCVDLSFVVACIYFALCADRCCV